VIHFVVIAGKPVVVRSLAHEFRSALTRTQYFHGEYSETVGPGAAWAAAAISACDPLSANRLVVDGDAMTVFNGPALAADVDQPQLAGELLARFRSDGSPGAVSVLGGSYNFVGIDATHGLRAFVDFSGRVPLYWHSGKDFVALSNRSTTVAAVSRSTGWDLRALAWLLRTSTLRGECMPANGACYLLPGVEVSAEWARGEPSFSRSPNWIWPSPADDTQRSNLSPREWSEITDELVANLTALSTVGPLNLLLSGGKDSRVCLALAKAAGLRDRVTTVTRGIATSPEVECAAAVAEAAGFAHKRAGPLAGAESPSPRAFDAEAAWRRLRQHTYRYEGIVSLWAGLNDRLRRTTLNIEGFGGEIYRRGGNDNDFRHRDVTSADDIASILIRRGDPLRLLRPAEVAFQDWWLRDWASGTAKGVHCNALPEKFFVDYRFGHWNGPMQQGKAVHITVAPILSRAAARGALRLSPTARSNDRLHFEIMRRTAPELLRIPFMKDTWAPEIARDSTIDLPNRPFPTTTPVSAPVLYPWPYKFLEHQANEVEQLFQEALAGTDMDSICDVRMLMKSVHEAAGIGNRAVQEVFSCITVALALLGESERVVDSCDDEGDERLQPVASSVASPRPA
jgi:hypothetical protein